jgi:hypothetical protein
MDLKSLIEIEGEEYIISTIKDEYKYETKVFRAENGELKWDSYLSIGGVKTPIGINDVYSEEYNTEEEAIKGHNKVFCSYVRKCYKNLTNEEFKQKLINEGYKVKEDALGQIIF